MIALGCDHGGFKLMQEVMAHLDKRGVAYKNFGTFTEESCDYPEYARKVTGAVKAGECEKGILICGTGIGISMAANRVPGIRCAVCHDCFSARATREHNDANVLAMGGRVIGAGHALAVVDVFLTTPFSKDERHIRRIEGMEELVGIPDGN